MTTIIPKEISVHRDLPTHWESRRDDGQLGRIPAPPEPNRAALVPARLRSELCI